MYQEQQDQLQEARKDITELRAHKLSKEQFNDLKDLVKTRFVQGDEIDDSLRITVASIERELEIRFESTRRPPQAAVPRIQASIDTRKGMLKKASRAAYDNDPLKGLDGI